MFVREADGASNVTQAGVVQLFHIHDTRQPVMTVSGDEPFSRFGANVFVS